MADVDEILKTLGFVLLIFLWGFVIPSLLLPFIEGLSLWGWGVSVFLWLLFPFVLFLLRYHSRGYEVPVISRVLR